MANATFFLFFVAHNAAGSQGVNERTKRGKKKKQLSGTKRRECLFGILFNQRERKRDPCVRELSGMESKWPVVKSFRGREVSCRDPTNNQLGRRQ